MHRATGRDTLRTIRRSLSRYLSIALIIAIGVAFFAGLTSTGSDMRLTADQYYTDTHTQDMQILSTLGFSQADLDAIAAIDGVDRVVGSYFVDCLTISPDNFLTRVLSLPDDPWQGNEDYLNRLALLEGRLPKQENECVIDQNIRDKYGFRLGDTLTLRSAREGDDLTDTLANTAFTVVGVANSPLYIDMSKRGATTVGDGSLDAWVYIPQSSFTADFYTQVSLTYAPARAYACYDEGYLPSLAPLRQALEAVAADRAEPRRAEMHLYLTDKITDGERQLAEGRAELDDARQQLADAQKAIDDARAELEAGRAQLEDGESTLRQEIAAGREQLASGQAAYEEGLRQYEDYYAQFTAGLAELEAQDKALADAEQQLPLLELSYYSLHAKLLFMEAIDTSTAAGHALLQYHASSITPDMNRFPDENGNSMGFGDMMYESGPYSTATPELVAAAHAALTDYFHAMKGRITDGRAQIDAARAQLQETETQLADFKRQLDEARAELESGRAQLDHAQSSGQQQLSDAKAELEAGEAELAEGEAEFLREAADAREKIAEGELELARAERKLGDAQRTLADLKGAEWYIYDRAEAQPGYAEFSDDADRMDRISAVFPVFFLAVATLVCMTTLARMVEEHRTEIGTFKALGYSDSRIRRKYMVYSLSATALGCALGLAVGFRIFPSIIITAYCMMYDLPAPTTPFHGGIAVGCAAVALLCVGLVTYFVCRSVLRQTPATIMRPKAPAAGKRIPLEYITPLWSRLSFSYKVTARNLFRYGKRVSMTVIGIAGCAALVLTGYGLQDAIDDIVRCQFDNVFHYDLLAGFSVDTEAQRQEIYDYLEAHALVADWMPQARQTLHAVGAEKDFEVNVTVSEDYARLTDYIHLQQRRSGEAIVPQASGAVVTEKLATLLGLEVGGTLTVRDSGHRTYEVEITGIAENYAEHFLYLSEEYYRAVFGQAPEYNSVILHLTDGGQMQHFKEALLADTAVQMISAVGDVLEQFTGITDNLGYVVALIIISAGLLAFVVLYNLSNINITERTREIATLKVLGFRDGEVSAYIYRENIILTVVGTALGMGLGVALTRFVVSAAEVDSIMVGRHVYFPSYLMAVVLTFAFSFLVNLIMHFRLRKVNMVESMKSVD